MTPTEPNKKKDYGSKYKLSVQVSLNGLSFLVIDDEASTVYFTKTVHFKDTCTPDEVLIDIENIFNLNNELNIPVKEVTVIHQNALYALVPKPVFQEDTPEVYLKLNSRVYPTDFVAFDTLDTFDIVNVYVPLVNVNNYFFDHYDSFTFLHSSTTFIESTLSKERIGGPLKMHVQLHKNQIDILVTNGKKVQFCNSFNYTTPEDFIYYILFTAEQLQLNPETLLLQLSGAITENDAYFDIAYTYIRHVAVINNEQNPSFHTLYST